MEVAATWTVVFVIATIALFIYNYIKRTYDFFEKQGIPYLKPIPVLGSSWRALLQRVSYAQEIIRIYNFSPRAKYVGIYEFFSPVVVIRDVELVKLITTKNFEHFHDHRSLNSDDTENLFSKNLVSLRGDRWKEMRTLLSPVFTSSKIKGMFVLMRECAQRYGDILAKLPVDQRILELKDIFSRYTNDVIASCAFGITVDSMTDRENKFYVYGKEAGSFTITQLIKFILIRDLPRLSKILGINFVRREVEEFFKNVVATNIKDREEKGLCRPDVIQTLLEAKAKLGAEKELTIDDMTAQAFIFYSGGLDSVSNLMCFAAYEIGVNQQVQERLQREIDQVMKECDGLVTYEAINDMKYLDAVVYEALRMYPAIPGTDRLCTKRFELPPTLPGSKPLVLEEGSYVAIPVYAIQRDPNYYDDPDTFNPDRFLGNSLKSQRPSALLSFGIGPRMCIGNRFALLETKILLLHIFAQCDLKPCAKTTIPMKLSKSSVFIRGEGGFWFEFHPRNQSRPLLGDSVRS